MAALAVRLWTRLVEVCGHGCVTLLGWAGGVLQHVGQRLGGCMRGGREGLVCKGAHLKHCFIFVAEFVSAAPLLSAVARQS